MRRPRPPRGCRAIGGGKGKKKQFRVLHEERCGLYWSRSVVSIVTSGS